MRYDASVYFKEPEHYGDCRICTTLTTEGESRGLFSNHLSNYATGCPHFIKMTAERRRTVATKAKLCTRCFHPDVVYSRSHDQDCVFGTGKRRNAYSCSNMSCKEHLWLCTTHKTQNKKALDKFKEDLARRGLQLTYIAKSPYLKRALPGQSRPDCGQCKDPVAGAIKKLKRKSKDPVVDVPEGDPMFMFFGAKGRTRSLNLFFDHGCSHCVMKNGVPGDELKGTLVQEGPFDIGGVGGAKVQALSEWVVLLDRDDGRKQIVQGLTVNRVTSDFPMIDLTEAVNAVKNDAGDNSVLQRCSLPPAVGGSVDILLGIMYSAIFPEPIHCMESGLTIYRSKLSPHHKGFNAVIGGPHSSFRFLAQKAGGTATLLAHFTEGLKAYRKWDGAPKIRNYYILDSIHGSEEEYTMMKAAQGKYAHAGEATEEEGSEGTYVSSHEQSQHCATCTGATAADERISFMKKNLDLQGAGLEIEYRCVRCRDCAQCKNADQTEKISLREEAEMVEIRNSVKLDWENKKIQCSLPLRGKEEDFLTSNRDRCVKVLDQQCNKYHNDVTTRETIVAAFKKLFENGHLVKLDDLTEEQKIQFIQKLVQYHIPWRVMFKESPTTPCRTVLDASSGTRKREDGSGGRCLNDLVCKGKIETLHLVNLLLRFLVGLFALTGDLTQFYNACKLIVEQWNLQRLLYREDLDPSSPIIEYVITTLIYGVKSVSAQSEHAMALLAEHIREDYPELANFIVKSRYVDDLADSKSTKEQCEQLIADAELNFDKIGLKCKAWSQTGNAPCEKASVDGISVMVGGIRWFPEIDEVETRIPLLHFSKKRRGRLSEDTVFFDGTMMKIEDHVPRKLTRRQVTSKVAAVFDIIGHLAPAMSGLKSDLREVVKNTAGWDDAMPDNLRNKWLTNFLKLENLRGIKFHRPVLPVDAIDCSMRLFIGVDAAAENLMIGTWGSFKRKNGSWSSQFLIGRPVLADSNSTIPKNELQALTGGSNLGWVVRLALSDWVTQTILFGDSVIALCWVSSENKQLSMFHRNRVIQIRRGTSLDDMYHCRTDHNPSDVGTRPAKVTLSDVGPNSRWNNDDEWMTWDLEKAVHAGIIKPVLELRLSKDDEDDFKEGLLLDKEPDILTRGHVVSNVRVAKIEERATFSNYLLCPTKFNFASTVRIYGHVMAFIVKCRKNKIMLGRLLNEGSLTFSVFSSSVNFYNGNSVLHHISTTPSVLETSKSEPNRNQISLLTHFSNAYWTEEEKNQYIQSHTTKTGVAELTDRYLNIALLYLFRKGTEEVKKFNGKDLVRKIGIEKEGVLLSKGRLLDGFNFSETGELDHVKLGSLGIKMNVPVLDRHSPLSYAIAQHVHWVVGRHRGVETLNRMSLEHVKIIQGANLYKELSEECIMCKKRRKKLLQVEMGPISRHQLNIAPAFWACQVDLFGPLMVFVPGFEKRTRNRQVLEAKVWIMTSVCLTTRAVNLQVLEKENAAGIVEVVTRLSCETGVPKLILCDQDTAILSAFKFSELEFRDLQLQLHRQKGIDFQTCPVSGHNMHGTVERIIRTIQESMDECGLKQKILHATGLQTLLKIIENQYNNIPLGYHYHQDQDNTPLLKLLTPNMLRVGRINSRSLDGPVRLPADRKEQLEAVEEVYDAWFKIWKESYLPKLFFKPKWYRTDHDLKVGDLVYFIKAESKLSNDYTMGMVEQVNTGKDGLIRRVVVKYFNETEKNARMTDRAVRSLVRIFSIDELCLSEDLAELQKVLDKKGFEEDASVDGNELPLDSDTDPADICLDIPESGLPGVEGSDVHTTTQALLADLSLQLQLGPSTPKVEEILAKFPLACHLTDIDMYRELVPSDIECEVCHSAMEETDNMDMLSQLIMSVNMKLD